MRRLRLRAGFRVLRRGHDQVQVGLDPRHALVLPATEAVRQTLAVLARHGPVDAADPAVLRRLAEHGALEPDATRAGGRVDLRHFGVVEWPGVDDLLEAAGLRAVDPIRGEADLGLLIGIGEPDRELLDPWVAEGLPHLVVRLTEGAAVVGPFVEPGLTACLRCVDGHHTDTDPRWPLLVEQQAAAVVRRDGVADPAPPALLSLAAAWTVTDLLTYTAGGRPATWSATLRLPERLADVELVSWLRHGECGCAWNQPLTMRA